MIRPMIVHGKEVSLGVILESDAEFALATINDPEVHRYLRNPGHIYTYDEEVQWIRGISSRMSTERVFAIVQNSDDSIVGIMGLHQIDWVSSTAYVGYLLAKPFWGKGYMTEAVSLLVEYAFQILNLRKLHTSLYEPNIASRRVQEKNGFVETGRHVRHVFVPGHGFVDEILMELFNKERQ